MKKLFVFLVIVTAVLTAIGALAAIVDRMGASERSRMLNHVVKPTSVMSADAQTAGYHAVCPGNPFATGQGNVQAIEAVRLETLPNTSKRPVYAVDTVFDSIYAEVLEEGKISLVKLIGNYVGKSLFVENIRIEIYDPITNKLILTIRPKVDKGYSPNIVVVNFDEKAVKQIFFGSATGGSGGYGSYYVYSVQNNIIKKLFDYEKVITDFTAKYLDNYRVELKSKARGKSYIIDISSKDKSVLDMVYTIDGKVKSDIAEPQVGALNSALPYFEANMNRYNLELLYRVTGQFSADAIGYIIDLAQLKESRFAPFFTMFGIV